MDVIAVYNYDIHIELVLSDLRACGIPESCVRVVPLRNQQVRKESDEDLDLAFLVGTVVMLLGCIYGYVLPGGPILWGFGGLVSGLATGWTAQRIWSRYRPGSPRMKEFPCILLRVTCDDEQAHLARRIMDMHPRIGMTDMEALRNEKPE